MLKKKKCQPPKKTNLEPKKGQLEQETDLKSTILGWLKHILDSFWRWKQLWMLHLYFA